MSRNPRGPSSPLGSEWPLRNAILFEWKFDGSDSMDEIVEKVRGYHFYIRVKDDLVVTISRNNSAVIFVLRQEDDRGGLLLVIQTARGRYSAEKIREEGTSIYGGKLGIRIEPSKLTPDETG